VPAPSLTRSQQRFLTFGWFFLVYTVFVALWGAYVRASLSGDGCGAHWPLCHGQVVPVDPSLKTLVELAHRVTSGICGILAVVVAVWARRAFPRGHLARLGAYLSLFFMITEALVGAGIVLLRLVAESRDLARGYWMAAHLVNTFALFFSITLMVLWARGFGALRRPTGLLGGLLMAGFALVLCTGVSGAIAALGDMIAPAESLRAGLAQDLSPSAHLFVRLRMWHPVIAIATAGELLFVVGLVVGREPDELIRRTAYVLGAVVLLQVAAGLLNLALLAPVAMQIVHLFLADTLWIVLVVLAASLLGRPLPSGELDGVQVEPARA
jgi:cytochrome c oxidase assembly protein subunit 15